MKPAAHLETAIAILDRIQAEARPSDALISAYFRDHRFIGSKDRAAISQIVFDMLRHWARLGWWCASLNVPDTARSRTLLYLRLVKGEGQDAITAQFNGAKFAPASLSPPETAMVQAIGVGAVLRHSAMPVQTALECPDWAWPGLQAAFGGGLESELAALLEPAPLDLRVNILKATRDDVLAALETPGITARPTPYSPWGIRVEGRPAIAQTDLYKTGAIEIQDEGSQLLAQLMDVRPGLAVADFCAGAGGKTLAMAALMANKGRIIACDVMERRLAKSRARFTRAGVDNVELHPLANENDPWVKRNAGRFDRVLVDAPCSGSGTWRRNPDARWKILGPSLAELLPLQARILASAARLVKPGGRLVYATCSLLPEENEGQVAAFLAAHPAFGMAGVQGLAPGLVKDGMMRLTPARHNTDGFFGAALEVKAA